MTAATGATRCAGPITVVPTVVVQDELDIVASDWRPSRVQSRDAICRAVMTAAAEANGLVHIERVRSHLPTWVNPHQVGATICALVRQGYLKPTGRFRPNGQTQSRNRTKRAEVRRLVKPIPPDALA